VKVSPASRRAPKTPAAVRVDFVMGPSVCFRERQVHNL
jgi:hypothetical protein